MLEINEQTMFSLSPNATLKSVLGKIFFLLDKKNGKQYNLTEMEYELLTMVRERSRFKEIKEALCREYDGEANQIDSDVREYMQSLFEHELIIVVESVET